MFRASLGIKYNAAIYLSTTPCTAYERCGFDEDFLRQLNCCFDEMFALKPEESPVEKKYYLDGEEDLKEIIAEASAIFNDADETSLSSFACLQLQADDQSNNYENEISSEYEHAGLL